MTIILIPLAALAFSPLGTTPQEIVAAPRELLILSRATLDASRIAIEANEPQAVSLYNELIKAADKALGKPAVSVMDKERVPPSGDKHDYMSQGPYWWPDPDAPDGLPYIRRDGVGNPEARSFTDKVNISATRRSVAATGLAYAFSADEKYAIKTAEVLRAWFIDEATRMNPHLNFGQAIPGRTKGRGIGIIETRNLGVFLDAIALIGPSGHWTEADEAGMQSWCKAYLHWLQTSEHGRDEAVHGNNHGTWYDVQAMSLALYTGQDAVARALAEKARTRRLDAHLAADGRQPHEVRRTKSWDYSVMNLRGLLQLTRLASKAGVDLHQHETPQGATLATAVDYLLPFALDAKEWPHDQIVPLRPDKLRRVLRLAHAAYPANGYSSAEAELRKAKPRGYWALAE